jgi:hypothetical protein
MAQATTSVDGYLSHIDWSTFNGKQAALGFTPYNSTNPSGYISGNQTITLGGILAGSGTTSITASAASGYYMPSTADESNWNGKQNALGFTPYNATNPAGYISSSALTPYALLAGATFSGAIAAPNVTDSALTSGNCVQASTAGILTTVSGPCGISTGSVTVTGSPTSGQVTEFSGGTSITNATSAHIQTAIGAGVYDASGAAATAQSNAETYASNASNLSSGTVALARMAQSSTSTSGYLSSTDWNTFNNKQAALTNPVTGPGSPTANDAATFTGTGDAVQDSGAPISWFGTGNANIGGSLPTASTGGDDTSVGYGALGGTTSGSYSTALGHYALHVNTIGNGNTAIGESSQAFSTTASYNTSVGDDSLGAATYGGTNSALGYQSLEFLTIGTNNTAIGAMALKNITTGSTNVAIGSQAGQYKSGGSVANTTSSSSTYIGASTYAFADGDTNENVIGNAATGNGSNTTTLGNSSITDTYLQGIVHGTSFTGTAANITATSNSTLTTLPSLSLPYSQVSGTPTAYVLPTATSTVLGGVKPDGTSILNTAGAISATAASVGADASGAAAARQANLSLLPGTYTNGDMCTYASSGTLLNCNTAVPSVGTWGALNYPTWTSGTPFVKMTAAGTFALDTNTYGTFTLPSLTSGSVLFSNGSTIAQDNSNFFWDATNHRLGIGTTGPIAKLDIVDTTTYPKTMISFRHPGIGDWGLTLGNEAISNLYIGSVDSNPTTRYFWRANYNTVGVAANTFRPVDASLTAIPVVEIQGVANTTANYLSITSSGGTMGNLLTVNSSGNVSIGDTTATSMFNVGTANQFQVSSIGVSSAGAGSTDLNGSGVPEAHCLADGTGGGVCGTSTPAFSAITSATNTTAAMVVGSGASLGASGTGTINATALNGATFASPGPIGFTTPNTSLFTSVTSGTLNMSSQCVSIASPAACASASQGFFIIAAGSTSVTVNTTHTTGVGTIAVYPDTSIGSALGVTCNTTLASIVNPVITARTAGTSFTVSIPGTLAVNPGCYSYTLIN